MKKILAITLAIFMVLSLCACANKEQAKTNCSSCGGSISKEASFCENCGVAVSNLSSESEDSSSSSDAPSSTESETEETSSSSSSSQTPNQPTTNNNPSTPGHTHSYSQKVTSATCTESGYTTYTCSCGDSYISDRTNAKGHTEVIDKAVAATKSSTGLTQGKHCSVCKTVLVAQQVTPKLEPSLSDMTTLTIDGIGKTCTKYSPARQWLSHTLIHDVKYKMTTTALNTIELHVNLTVELTSYYMSETMNFRWELHDSNGVCVKSEEISQNVTKGTKYNIERFIYLDEAGDYTLKLVDIGRGNH